MPHSKRYLAIRATVRAAFYGLIGFAGFAAFVFVFTLAAILENTP